jgi:predicted metal-dependent peptidase
MKTQTTVERRIQKARTTLLLDHPFFGSLVFRLKGRESRSIETMATDGISLFYNPNFVDTLNAATLCGVLAHEVLHPGLQHHVRRSGRDPKRWNEACDYAINPILLDAGLHLPEGVLLDDRFREMSAEQIYNQLQTEAEEEPGDPDNTQEAGGDGTGSPHASSGDPDEHSAPVTEGGIGQVLDAPAANEEATTVDEQAREWSVAVSQAVTLAKRAGKVPAGMERSLDGAAEAAVDWRELLRRAWSETTPADYSWMRPNRATSGP